MAGQGTIGLEILSDLPTVDMIFVPAGGGGLLSGISACVKQINPRIQVIGVQAEGASAHCEFLSSGWCPSDRKCTHHCRWYCRGAARKISPCNTLTSMSIRW